MSKISVNLLAVRRATEALCAPLEYDDHLVQSAEFVSPPKWHLAHTTWFFETFLLKPHLPNYRDFDPEFGFLFNSYYEAIGTRLARPRRGSVSRPTLTRTLEYRRHVDEHLGQLAATAEIERLIELGIHHEQQHQELLLMDIKHILFQNPSRPAYQKAAPVAASSTPVTFLPFDGGLVSIGHTGDGFAFDNESPRHRVFLEPYAMANRAVTNADYLKFIEADGYRDAQWWLSDGWDAVKRNEWTAPLYWEKRDGQWFVFTLQGNQGLIPHEPVCHVSGYEAHAFARWSGARLATESEWENAFFEGPASLAKQDKAWEWTSSAFGPYPGYCPPDGALGEYNGKFMSNQLVLRGGCEATPAGHARLTYRNFYPPEMRWQFSGIRLAKDPK